MENIEIQDFIDDYRKRIEELKRKALFGLKSSYEKIDSRINAEDHFIEMGRWIDKLKSFSFHNEKIENLKKERANCRTAFFPQASRKPDAQIAFEILFSTAIDEIIGCANDYNRTINTQIELWISRIKECPFGEKENQSRNAMEFQNSVMNLIDWLFIDELKRIDLSKIQDGSQRRDGGYEALDEFNTQSRCNFGFSSIFIECKNYKKPNYMDLMQVFAYTLLCQESKIFQIPLSLLISRENPSENSFTWKIRGAIFNRRIEEETRLILFLDQVDLETMAGYKTSGGDPALRIKEKIREFSDWKIKGGY